MPGPVSESGTVPSTTQLPVDQAVPLRLLGGAEERGGHRPGMDLRSVRCYALAAALGVELPSMATDTLSPVGGHRPGLLGPLLARLRGAGWWGGSGHPAPLAVPVGRPAPG